MFTADRTVDKGSVCPNDNFVLRVLPGKGPPFLNMVYARAASHETIDVISRSDWGATDFAASILKYHVHFWADLIKKHSLA